MPPGRRPRPPRRPGPPGRRRGTSGANVDGRAPPAPPCHRVGPRGEASPQPSGCSAEQAPSRIVAFGRRLCAPRARILSHSMRKRTSTRWVRLAWQRGVAGLDSEAVERSSGGQTDCWRRALADRDEELEGAAVVFEVEHVCLGPSAGRQKAFELAERMRAQTKMLRPPLDVPPLGGVDVLEQGSGHTGTRHLLEQAHGRAPSRPGVDLDRIGGERPALKRIEQRREVLRSGVPTVWNGPGDPGCPVLKDIAFGALTVVARRAGGKGSNRRQGSQEGERGEPIDPHAIYTSVGTPEVPAGLSSRACSSWSYS